MQFHCGLSQLPNCNCYVVVPGKLLAGEYPGAKEKQQAALSLKKHIDWGVTCFVDLTEPRELIGYEQILRGLAAGMDRRVDYHRFSIPDVDVPASKLHTAEILDCIDAALRANHCLYLHCFGGVGRTGTIVGCWLVRHKLTGKQASTRLVRLCFTTRIPTAPSILSGLLE